MNLQSVVAAHDKCLLLMNANGSSVLAQQLISACALGLSHGVALAASDMIRLLTK
jgi:hypothetical protein